MWFVRVITSAGSGAASTPRRQKMAKMPKYRLRDRIHEVYGDVVEEWAGRTQLSPHDVGVTAAEILVRHEDFQEVVRSKVERTLKRKNGDGVIGDSIRPIWEHLSKPEVVATDFGWKFRRMILGCVCGPSTTYPEAVAFLGGNLSQGAFHDAKIRRKDALTNDDITRL